MVARPAVRGGLRDGDGRCSSVMPTENQPSTRVGIRDFDLFSLMNKSMKRQKCLPEGGGRAGECDQIRYQLVIRGFCGRVFAIAALKYIKIFGNFSDTAMAKAPGGWLRDAKNLSELPIVELRSGDERVESSMRNRCSHIARLCGNMHNYNERSGAADMQTFWAGGGASARAVNIPDPDHEVVPGVAWGMPEVPNTPAYWAVRCQWEDANPDYVSRDSTLPEEAGFCLLGGYGIKYEVNIAAFERLKANGVFDLETEIEVDEIIALLKEPLRVEGRSVRYRFPNQRAQRLVLMRDRLRHLSFDNSDPQAMREALLLIEGIGPKTASWIVRNLLGSDEVAIIDVHILRACVMMGVFPEEIRLPRDYAPLERRFIDFSHAIDVRPSVLDAVMWSEMRSIPARSWSRYGIDS